MKEKDLYVITPFPEKDLIYREFRKYYSVRDYEGAKRFLQSVIDDFLDQVPASDDTEYHDFRNGMEGELYNFYFFPKKVIGFIDGPISLYYSLCGRILTEQGKLNEAKGAYAEALSWNPVNFTIFSEYADIFRREGDMESFAALSRWSLKYAVLSTMTAKVMRSLAMYFTSRKEYVPAAACYQRSLVYDPGNKTARQELSHIKSLPGSNVRVYTDDEMPELADKYDFPVGPDNDVVEYSSFLAGNYRKDGDREMARLCYSVVYDLTDDREAKAALDELTDSNKGRKGK